MISQRNVRAKHRPLLPAVIGAVLILFILLTVVGRAAWAAYQLQTDARLLMGSDMTALLSSSGGDVAAQVVRTGEDWRALRASLGPLVDIAPVLGWLPEYGGDFANAPALFELVDRTLVAGTDTLRVSRSLLADVETGSAAQIPIGTALVSSIQARGQSVAQVKSSVDQVNTIRQRVDAARLSPSLRTLLERFDKWFPYWQLSVEALANAPSLLGSDRPRSFLLIAQNSDELRATGGFVSGVALVQVDQGKITVGPFMDAFSVEDLAKEHPGAPEPLLKYMYAWNWVFRDGNWSPDVPTSARDLISLYELNQGIKADGVIAVNLGALPGLISALGPLQVEGDDEPVTAENVTRKIRGNWSNPFTPGLSVDWWKHRKDIIGELARLAMDRLMSGEFDRTALVRALAASAISKDVWLFLEGGDASPAVVFPPNATVYRGSADALLIVDSNVGFNKVNGNIRREIDYAPQVEASGSIRAVLAITYTNSSADTNTYCVHQPLYFAGYADLQQGCYWDYVRVLVPPGAELVYAAGLVDVTIQTAEQGRTVFAGYLIVPRGESRTVRLTYRLPLAIKEGSTYTLYLERQPGVPATPVSVHLSLPFGWSIAGASPDGAQLHADGIDLRTTLDRDQIVRAVVADGMLPRIELFAGAAAFIAVGGIAALARTRRRSVRP